MGPTCSESQSFISFTFDYAIKYVFLSCSANEGIGKKMVLIKYTERTKSEIKLMYEILKEN